MAETRKYDPAAGNAIAQALRAAMGEPVRPNQPGSRPTDAPLEAPAAATTSWVTVQFSKPAEPEED
jgi:hypothetical protein